MDCFFLLYVLVLQIHCGYNELIVSKKISGIQGSLVSPGYPGNYPNNVNYTWILDTGHEKATVNFTFDAFDIVKYHGHSAHCTDNLTITEIDPCCYEALKRCGQFRPFSWIVSGTLIRITFVSDKRHTAKGFSLKWIVSRPPSLKTTTPAPIPITKTQKSTTRTTKLPNRTTMSLRKTTKITTRTTTFTIRTTTFTTRTTTFTTRTTKLQGKSTLKTTAATTRVNQTSTDLKETTPEISSIRTQQPTVGTTPSSTNKNNTGENLTPYQIVILAVGIGVIEATLVTVGICIVKHRRNSSAENSRAMRDKKDKNRHVGRKTVVSVNNVYDCIPLEHFQAEDTIEEEGLYVDLPQNLYDEAFVKRPHVNEKNNVYQGYNE